MFVCTGWRAAGLGRGSLSGAVYIYIYRSLRLCGGVGDMTQTTTKTSGAEAPNHQKKDKKNNISRPGLPTNFPQMISLFFNLPTISLIKGNWQGLSHNLLPQSLPTISHNFPTIPGTPFSCAQ